MTSVNFLFQETNILCEMLLWGVLVAWRMKSSGIGQNFSQFLSACTVQSSFTFNYTFLSVCNIIQCNTFIKLPLGLMAFKSPPAISYRNCWCHWHSQSFLCKISNVTTTSEVFDCSYGPNETNLWSPCSFQSLMNK